MAVGEVGLLQPSGHGQMLPQAKDLPRTHLMVDESSEAANNHGKRMFVARMEATWRRLEVMESQQSGLEERFKEIKAKVTHLHQFAERLRTAQREESLPQCSLACSSGKNEKIVAQ